MTKRIAPLHTPLQNTLDFPFNLLVVEHNVWEPDVTCEGTCSMSTPPYSSAEHVRLSLYLTCCRAQCLVDRCDVRERVACPLLHSSLQNTLDFPFNLLVVEHNVWEPDVT
jgi:hypothetical protein